MEKKKDLTVKEVETLMTTDARLASEKRRK